MRGGPVRIVALQGIRNGLEIDNRFRPLHSWLRWICRMPKPLPGFVQGVLPPLFLAILFLLLPFVLKGWSVLERIKATFDVADLFW